MNNRIKEIVEKMARTGYELFYDEKWESLDENSIEKHHWRNIAINMLRTVNFPSYLYKVCQKISTFNYRDINDVN